MRQRNEADRGVAADVSRDLLAHAGRFFVGGIEEITSALLHNARRAGASRVAVSTNSDAGTVTVSDDGRGLEADDARLLITLGGTSWDDATTADEMPAGMSFHVLSTRGAIVRSKDWRMTITTGAFLGDEEAIIASAPELGRGFSVTFPYPALKDLKERGACETPSPTWLQRCVSRRRSTGRRSSVQIRWSSS